MRLPVLHLLPLFSLLAGPPLRFLGALCDLLKEDEEPHPWELGLSRSAACESCQAVAQLLFSRGDTERLFTESLLDLYNRKEYQPAFLSLHRDVGEEAEPWLKRMQHVVCDGGLMKYYASGNHTAS